MYAVVGCRDCAVLWIVAGRPDSTSCPRCGTRREFETLRRFVETDDPSEARQARAALLADRQGRGEAFADLGSFEELADRAEAGMDEDARLEAAGVDPDAVGDAGERAERGAGSIGSGRRAVVREAVRELETPDEQAVLDYASARGVDETFARDALERLVRSGEATRRRGTYRLV